MMKTENKNSDISLRTYYEKRFLEGDTNYPKFEELSDKDKKTISRSVDYSVWKLSICIRHFGISSKKAAENFKKNTDEIKKQLNKLNKNKFV